MAPSDALSWAVKELRDETRLEGIRVARDYYEGRHKLAFATDKFRTTFAHQFGAVRDNLCPAVVDSVADRLKITGVEADPEGEATEDIATEAWRIWQRNRMDVRAPETHKEALLTGDGYSLVWPNQAGESVIWPLPAEEVVVAYDSNAPGVLTYAARAWQNRMDGFIHVDIYYVDRVERWRSKTPRRHQWSGSWKPGDFIPYTESGGMQSEGVFPHNGERVPVIHFPNLRFHANGISELYNVLPLQDALNKTMCDMLVAQEFSAFPQRWATGVDTETDGAEGEAGRVVNPPFDYGVDRMLAVANEMAKFGAFPTSDLRQYIEVEENLRSEIARVSGTPLHYLFITRGDFPSGEAMKSAEARFTRKVEQRQEAFGNQWEDLLALALRFESEDSMVAGSDLTLQWESASPTAGDAGEPLDPNAPIPAPPGAPPDDSLARSSAQPRR